MHKIPFSMCMSYAFDAKLNLCDKYQLKHLWPLLFYVHIRNLISIKCRVLIHLNCLNGIEINQFSSVQTLSRVWLFATPWIAVRQASLSITNSRSLLKLMPIKSVMPSSHLILCHPLLLLPPISPSIRLFSNESTLHMRWPKYWSFSFSISPSNEQPRTYLLQDGLVGSPCSPRVCKSLLQHHSSKASVFRCSAFFTIQLSHPYMTTGKIIALTRWAFVSKVMSLLFNMLSRLVITFLPRSKRLLIHGCNHQLQWFWNLKK